MRKIIAAVLLCACLGGAQAEERFVPVSVTVTSTGVRVDGYLTSEEPEPAPEGTFVFVMSEDD